MIKQAFISKSLAGLDFKKKYGLTDYVDSIAPLLQFGFYREEDIAIFRTHKAPINLVFQGSDALLLTASLADILKHRIFTSKDCKVYAISEWISSRLHSWGIPHQVIPISATIQSEWENCPNGDKIYAYASDMQPANFKYYGGDLFYEVEKQTGIEVIIGNYGKYNREELTGLYKQSFINLRLTKFDGCPNTVLEMGLMGRKSIYNGSIDGCIKWQNIDDICQNVIVEYGTRKYDNSKVSEQFNKYLNINTDFLHEINL